MIVRSKKENKTFNRNLEMQLWEQLEGHCVKDKRTKTSVTEFRVTTQKNKVEYSTSLKNTRLYKIINSNYVYHQILVLP